MAIDATASREEKFRWLQKPLDLAISAGIFSLLGTFSLATSGLDLRYAIAWQAASTAAMLVLVYSGMLRMSWAAGKL